MGFIIKGRKDLQFISGGENIQPGQIDRALMNIEGVLEAICVPVYDKTYGHRPVAFINTDLKSEKIQKLLEGTLPKYKIPIHMFSLKELSLKQMKWKRSDLIKVAESLRYQATL